MTVVVKVQPSGSMVDKVKTRLEQLDDFEEGSVRQMLDLSQQQYTARIEQLNNELVQAWHSDQRVKALKIAIQVLIRLFNPYNIKLRKALQRIYTELYIYITRQIIFFSVPNY